MNLRQKIRLAFQVTWAISILWIYVGSLVNFHQHHLWRRQLIPQVVSSLNKNEKSKVSARFHKKVQDSNNKGFQLSPALPKQFETPSLLIPGSALLLAQGSFADYQDLSCQSPGLRAPPAL
jgi:hypothetical protein